MLSLILLIEKALIYDVHGQTSFRLPTSIFLFSEKERIFYFV